MAGSVCLCESPLPAFRWPPPCSALTWPVLSARTVLDVGRRVVPGGSCYKDIDPKGSGLHLHDHL